MDDLELAAFVEVVEGLRQTVSDGGPPGPREYGATAGARLELLVKVSIMNEFKYQNALVICK